MQIISSKSKIIIDPSLEGPLKASLSHLAPHKIFIVADSNTKKYCYPLVGKLLKHQNVYVKIIGQGESSKNINTVKVIWEFLQENKCDRNDLLINLGGGMILDIGGFAASTFKRGIQYMNIPTTLLSMVDASVGGKVGFNFNDYKNHIGLFSQPAYVIINSVFLSTLDRRQLYSGWAEMIKHGIIHSEAHLENLITRTPEEIDTDTMNKLIGESVHIKNHFVEKDPFENNIRKALNFGHTIGHALESYSFKNSEVLHGEAVAAGMICELYLSGKFTGLSGQKEKKIQNYLTKHYPFIQITNDMLDDIVNYMRHDKKNIEGKINFVLIKSPGSYSIDNFIDIESIKESLNYYSSLA
ncbi:MAG: 3-dehydroquinate synthase [Bacteroidales bacterium]